MLDEKNIIKKLIIFSTNSAKKTRFFPCKGVNVDPCLSSCSKISWNWIKNLELDIVARTQGKALERSYLLHIVNTASPGMAAALTQAFVSVTYTERNNILLSPKVHFSVSKKRHKHRVSENFPQSPGKNTKNWKMRSYEIKVILYSKGNNRSVKRQGGETFANYISDSRLMCRIYKELQKLKHSSNTQSINGLIKGTDTSKGRNRKGQQIF